MILSAGKETAINDYKFKNVLGEKIKKETGIDFHSLRKTHLTNLNTPLLEFQLRSGHKKIETAQKYYINRNAMAQKILTDNVETVAEVFGLPHNVSEVSQSEWMKRDFEKLKAK